MLFMASHCHHPLSLHVLVSFRQAIVCGCLEAMYLEGLLRTTMLLASGTSCLIARCLGAILQKCPHISSLCCEALFAPFGMQPLPWECFHNAP